MPESSDARLIGIVKWYNAKPGIGFITILSEGEFHNKEIFVHYLSISFVNCKVPSETSHVYLVNGEYVELSVVPAVSTATSTKVHEFQAANVLGIMGGPLLCESRSIVAAARGKRADRNTDSDDPGSAAPPTSVLRRGQSASVRSRIPKPANAPPSSTDYVDVVRGKKPKARTMPSSV